MTIENFRKTQAFKRLAAMPGRNRREIRALYSATRRACRTHGVSRSDMGMVSASLALMHPQKQPVRKEARNG